MNNLENIDNLYDLELYCTNNTFVKEEKVLIYNKYYNWFKNNIYNTKELVMSLARITKDINCTIDDVIIKNYIPKSLSECLYKEALKINPNYIDFFYTSFIKFNTDFYELLYRNNYKICTINSTMNDDINLFKYYIKKGEDIYIINSYKGTNINDDELLDILFTNKYIINENSPKGIKNNVYALSKALDYGYDTSIIDYYDDYNELNNSFIDSIFKKGYKITINSSKKILNNTYAFMHAINKGEDINIINLFTYDKNGNNNYLDIMKEMVFNSNYVINSNTPKSLLNDKNKIQSYIINNKNINPYIIDYIDINLDKTIIKILFDRGYTININTKLYIIEDNEMMKAIYDKKYPCVCNNILKDLEYNYGYLVFFLENINYNDHLLDYINDDINSIYILKYVFYGNDSLRNKLINIINNNQYILFNNIYNYLFDYFDSNLFIDMLNNYKYNFNIYNDILKNKEVINNNKEMKTLIIKKLVYDKDDNMYVNSINDLEEYKDKIHKKNEDIILLNNLIYTKNVILNCLFNLDYNKVSYILKYIINSKKIIDLINSTNYLESILIEYRYFIEVIEYIYLEEDIEKLNNIAININNSDYFCIWNLFKNFERDIKNYYGKEINEKIINYNELINIKYYDVPKVNNEKSYFIEDYKGIKYITLNGLPFVTFIHEMNKYNNTSKLIDFKTNKFIGKSYISLSSIGDNYCVIDKVKSNSVDDLVLLFDVLPYNQLYLESNDDIMTNSNYNDLNINSLPPNFNSVRTNITLTKYGNYNYSEYVYYRDNIKVGAIMVLGDEPSEYEVMGAKYLNVPLVKINYSKYPNLNYEQRIKNDNRLKNFYYDLLKFRNIKEDSNIVISLRSAREMLSKYFIINKNYKEKIYI